jgi:Tfp pilus assembly protein PilF
MTCFDKAVIINPGYAEAYSNRGVVLGKLGRNGDAAESYRKALTIKPDYADAKANLESLPQ